ncbi:MAG TPA: hypothetical protein VH560_07675 [Polyangia bacterium]|nr:hypothetical protein [Polyangia bacterium]
MGQACACNEIGIGNTCVPAPCAVDSDCGAGGFCGPIVKVCASPAIVAYQCYSSRDQCVLDADCPTNEECVALPGEAWACHVPGVCR